MYSDKGTANKFPLYKKLFRGLEWIKTNQLSDCQFS